MKESQVLMSSKEIEVRFHELDPMGVVWHGNYIKYFEVGREDFGQKYNLSYPDFLAAEIMAPIISLECDYKKYVKYGEPLVIETKYENCAAAKIILSYSIFYKKNMELVATGKTQQVFTDTDGNLLICSPPFYSEWKESWGIENS